MGAGWTSYSVVGDLPGAARAPLVILHGGPGSAHDYFEPVAELTVRTGREVVFYDQLGFGRSHHLSDAPREQWTPELFWRELDALLAHLALLARYHILGRSALPVLVISGEHDVATPTVVRPLLHGLADARWELVDGTSHSTHLERPDLFLELLGTFLASHD